MAEHAVAPEEMRAHTEVIDHAGGELHAEPAAFGIVTPAAWVGLAMLALIAVAIWKKVPGLLASGLDSSIAEIRKQLDEAKALRAEAEALRKEYSDKIANAERDAAAMLETARHEAEAIVAKAEADTTDMIARREKMADDKIGAAERAAIDDLRATAASAAASAARGLIREKHSAAADKVLIDEAINSI